VVKLLKGQVSPRRVGQRARQQGIDFEVTPVVEKELRQAGASDDLIAILRQLAPNPAPIQVRENAKDGLKYVWIPPGTFMMGCSRGDNECFEPEMPRHQLTLTQGFWLGQTEVTVGAYKRFAATSGRQMLLPQKYSSLCLAQTPCAPKEWSENTPISMVGWDDAQAYCAWTGGRLPTEAEWEYAARGGNREARYGPFGSVAGYADNSGQQRLDSTRLEDNDWQSFSQQVTENGNRRHEVGLKQANRFGLYDMLGNVWEWVNDWFDEHYYKSTPAQDPPGPVTGKVHVIRGGSSLVWPRLVRVSVRPRWLPDYTGFDVGFRCAEDGVNP